MEQFERRALLASVGVLGVGTLARLAHAGPLTPPTGPVEPTGRTLAEIAETCEPRIAVQSLIGSATASYVVLQPGAYFLQGNLVGVAGRHGILIAADGVSIDLRGFSVQGVAGSLGGIAVSGTRRAIHVFNGNVSGWGQTGVQVGNQATVRSVCSSLNAGSGIETRDDSLVLDCISVQNGQFGVSAESACRVSGCVVKQNGGRGIDVADDSSVIDCIVSANGQGGIDVFNNCLVEQCIVHGNGGEGGIIVSGSRGIVRHNLCDNNSAPGIWGQGSIGPHVEGNLLTLNTIGVRIDGIRGLVVGNRFRENTTPQFFTPSTSYGPFVAVGGGGDLSAIPGSSHPLANLLL